MIAGPQSLLYGGAGGGGVVNLVSKRANFRQRRGSFRYTFDRYGSPMPDWDQWDAEAMELLVPWFTGDHFVAHLFHPHNEHRILLTKLQNLIEQQFRCDKVASGHHPS